MKLFDFTPSYEFKATFAKGTTPTFLDASEAQRLVGLIRSVLLTELVESNDPNLPQGMFWVIGDKESRLSINLPFKLEQDKDPHLGADLKLNGYNIIANLPSSVFEQNGSEGFPIYSSGGNATLRLLSGTTDTSSGTGFMDGGADVIWMLPDSDASTEGEFIFGGADETLGWTSIISSPVADKGGIHVTFNTSTNKWEIGLDQSSTYARGIYLTAGAGTVSGDTDITPYENYFDFIIGKGLTATGNDSTGAITLEADAESLTVEEIDGSPTVSEVTTIKVSNGQLTNNGSGVVTICTAQEIYLTATGTGQASGGPVGPHPGYEHYDFVAGDGMELKQATTHADGVEFVVQETTLTGDSGSDDWTPGEGINFVGGMGIVTEVTVASQPSVVTTKVDDDVCMSINGIGVGDISANDFSISAGDNITISTDTSGITIEADKYAIVESPNPDEYVSLACTEMPETRFDDIVKLDVSQRSFTYDLDPTYLFVCEDNSIEPISYVCDEPAIAGLKVNEGTLFISFSTLTDLPNTITVKLSGIRKGRADKRFVKWSKEAAQNNAQFWNGWRG